MQKDFSKYIGKTIASMEIRQASNQAGEPLDDKDLVITFTDGTAILVEPICIEEWTGNSIGEYPTEIGITDYEPDRP